MSRSRTSQQVGPASATTRPGPIGCSPSENACRQSPPKRAPHPTTTARPAGSRHVPFTAEAVRELNLMPPDLADFVASVLNTPIREA